MKTELIGELTDERGVFVVGCPRSGTYLLSTILNHHFSTAIPIETHFIPIFYRYLFLWGDLEKKKNRMNLLNDIFEFFEIWTRIETTGRDFQKEKNYSLLSVKNNIDEIIESSKSYSDIVRGLFRSYANKNGATNWGDKSTFYRHIPLERLVDSVSDIYIIHIVRDPRDVVMSWNKLWCGPKSIYEAADAWKEHIEKKRAWGAKNPERYLEIKYEDLISNYFCTLDIISDFIGIHVSNHDIPFWESNFAKTLGAGETHMLIRGPLDSGNSGKWSVGLPDKHVQSIESHIGNCMKECGYKLSGYDPVFPRVFWKVFQNLFEFFSIRSIKLKIKNNLPFFIFVSRLAGLQLSRVFITMKKCGLKDGAN